MVVRGRDMKRDEDQPGMGRTNITLRNFYDFLTVIFYLRLTTGLVGLFLNDIPFVAQLVGKVLSTPLRTMLGHNAACFACDYYMQVYDEKKNQPNDEGEMWAGAPSKDDDDDED